MIGRDLRLQGFATAVVALLGAGCGDSSDPVAPIVTQPGRISVSVQTTGGDPDNNGYEIVVGASGTRFFTTSNGIGFDFPAGTHTVKLEGVNSNCAVTGANPLSITVAAGSIANAGFLVTCETTGIVVTTTTSGPDMPATYQVMVDNPPPVTVAVNGPTVVSRLAPGTHVITLSPGADNCAITNARTITVEVLNRAVTPVRFDVTCSAITRIERIAYAVSSGTSGGLRIGVVKPDGTGAVDLVSGHSPDWSPDGAKLVYSTVICIPDGYYDYDECSGSLVLIVPETRVITGVPNTMDAMEPSFSPSGTEVAFVRCCDGYERYIYISPLGGPPVQLMPSTATIPFLHSVRDPSWSPDGQRLAFSCMVEAGNNDICTMKRDGTGLIRLTNTFAQHEEDPVWSPDGKTIAFTLTGLATTRIALIAAEGGAVTILADGFHPDWSPDGSKLVFARNAGLFVVKADGTGIVQITNGGEHSPTWRP